MKSFLTISAVVILVLAVLTPQASACKYGCTPGYWKNHIEAWPSAITTTETLGENFNVGFSATSPSAMPWRSMAGRISTEPNKYCFVQVPPPC
ncbi:MAG TPA: hypothetical protein VD837_16520 [Terriglobales bacterium]|nr:hypothetical protein [Terriglobales bacterium]